jgi:hypothetical protein
MSNLWLSVCRGHVRSGAGTPSEKVSRSNLQESRGARHLPEAVQKGRTRLLVSGSGTASIVVDNDGLTARMTHIVLSPHLMTHSTSRQEGEPLLPFRKTVPRPNRTTGFAWVPAPSARRHRRPCLGYKKARFQAGAQDAARRGTVFFFPRGGLVRDNLSVFAAQRGLGNGVFTL